MNKLTRYFINGVVVLAPALATAYVVYVIYRVFLRIEGFFKFEVPGLGIAATLALIMLVGVAASNFLTKRVVGAIDLLFARLPFLKMIYTSVRDLTGAFVGEKKGFNMPVAVELMPGSNVRVIGFMTKDGLSELGLKESAAVYLPQSYNFAGNLIIVPSGQVSPIDAEASSVMAFIVSGGLSAIHPHIGHGK